MYVVGSETAAVGASVAVTSPQSQKVALTHQVLTPLGRAVHRESAAMHPAQPGDK